MDNERIELVLGAARDMLALIGEFDIREIDELRAMAMLQRENFRARWGIGSREIGALRQCMRIVQEDLGGGRPPPNLRNLGRELPDANPEGGG